VIVKLQIGAKAKRSHGTERKCRCSSAKCLGIYAKDGTELKTATSIHDSAFTYEVGKLITPTNGFNDDRWKTCEHGIHFYLTREEAENHS